MDASSAPPPAPTETASLQALNQDNLALSAQVVSLQAVLASVVSELVEVKRLPVAGDQLVVAPFIAK